MEKINTSALFATKNVKNSLFMENALSQKGNSDILILHGNTQPLDFVKFINDEMINNTCQSINNFKNPDVMCMDSVIGEAYSSLLNIHKKRYTVSPNLIKAMKYFSYNCTLVTLVSLSKHYEGVLFVPAYPRLLARKCVNTVEINNYVFKQWSQSDLNQDNQDNLRFEEIVTSINKETFENVISDLLVKFPLGFSNISVKKLWKIFNANTKNTLKLKCSLAITWLANHDVFYEPPLKCMGYSERISENNVFANLKNINQEEFKLKIGEN